MYSLIEEPRTIHDSQDPNLLLIDVRAQTAYERGHIPGAICVQPKELVCGERPATGKLPDKLAIETLLSRIGYAPDRQVVAYDDEGGGWAGRLIWNLDMVGHTASSLMNGGLVAWYHEGLPLTTDLPEVKERAVTVEIQASARASKEDVLASLSDEQTLIWDARTAEEYNGQRVTALRGGHIPGAINLDWQETMDPARSLRVREDISKLLSDRGLLDGQRIITHCQTHHRSGLTYVIGKSLGLDIRAYDGSWSEWGNDPELPVEGASA